MYKTSRNALIDLHFEHFLGIHWIFVRIKGFLPGYSSLKWLSILPNLCSFSTNTLSQSQFRLFLKYWKSLFLSNCEQTIGQIEWKSLAQMLSQRWEYTQHLGKIREFSSINWLQRFGAIYLRTAHLLVVLSFAAIKWKYKIKFCKKCHLSDGLLP